VTFFTREHGKLRGVAKAARRLRSRFGGALELLTLGELVFFDTGRSDLVRVDHFDVTRPFVRLREDLERLGRAAWAAEMIARLTAEQDRHVGLFALLVKSLRALEASPRPGQVAVCFALRCLDLLGHRPRLDGCTGCHRRWPFPRPALGLGGLLCEACTREEEPGAPPLPPGAVGVLERLRTARWEDALAASLGRLDAELPSLLDAHVARLIGQPTRAARFLREVGRLTPG
jgi:DNA repair protein RecO (recombination protein O)